MKDDIVVPLMIVCLSVFATIAGVVSMTYDYYAKMEAMRLMQVSILAGASEEKKAEIREALKGAGIILEEEKK